MAKRHPALVPVSRDHHDGLLLAVRLQQGERALLRLWSHEPAWQARYVVEFYRDHLQRHFAVEEEQIFPLAVKHVAAAVPIVQELSRQHESLRSAVEGMKGREASVLRSDLESLGKLLEEHIRLEDRQLFPLMEEHIDPGHLDRLEKDVQEYYSP